MDTLRLVVNVDRAQLDKLQTDVQAIRNTTIRVNVEAVGVDKVSKEMLEYAKYTAQATAEERKLETQRAKTAQAAARQAAEEAKVATQREKTAQAASRQAAEEAKLATQLEKTATAEEQARVANIQLSTQIEKTNTAQAQQAVQAEKTATAQVNLATQLERTNTAQAQTALQTEKTATAQANLAVQQERTNTAQVNAAAAAERHANAQRTANEQVREGSTLSRLLGNDLDVIIAKMAAWQIIGAGVAGVIRSFHDAVETMKEVDAELTNIQKVTDRTDAQMKEIAESAYDVASAYGIAAQDYLNSVAEFAKAGFGDQSEALAELATKTQLVGDVTSDTANKFLLSANAAWKMNGSIAELSTVLDKANAVENNFATSIEKIAEGFPIVASTASQAGLSVEETIALLGTITSVTQETGTKAATALRALILNIEGAVGEYEDGIEVTEESVKSLNTLLNVYAADAMKAAEAQGKMIDPMEAIAALAKASEQGLLNQKDLFEVLSGLGGKLRTNQLTALVENFDMVNKQIATMQTSLGSADREMDVMLSSWESKTNILSNKWTQFISHLVDTDLVKGGLDVMIGAVEVLDSDFTQLAATVGVVTLAVSGLQRVLALVAATRIGGVIASLLAGVNSLQGALMGIATILAGSPLFWVTAGVAALYGVVKVVDALNTTTEEHAKEVQETSRAYQDAQKELDELNDKLEENKRLLEEQKQAGASEVYITRLETENARLERQIELQKAAVEGAKQAAAEAARSALTDTSYDAGVQVYGVSRKHVDIYDYAEGLLEAAKADAEFDDALQETIETLQKQADALAEAAGGAENLEGEDKALYDRAQELTDAYIRFTKEILGFSGSMGGAASSARNLAGAMTEQSEAQQAAYETADELEKQCKAVGAALKDYKDYGNLTKDSIDGLQEAVSDLLPLLYDEEGKLSDVGIEALETANKLDSTKAATEYLMAAAQRANFQNLIGQIQAAGAAAVLSAGQISVMLQAIGVASGAADAQARGIARTAQLKGTTAGQEFMRYYDSSLSGYLNSQISALNSQMDSIVSSHTKTTSGTKSSSSGGTKSETDAERERLEKLVAARKEAVAYAKAHNAATSEQIRLIKQEQDAQHELNNYLRSKALYQSAAAKEQAGLNTLTKEESQLLIDIRKNSEDYQALKEEIVKLQEEENKAILDGKKELVESAESELSLLEKQEAGEETRIAAIERILSALDDEIAAAQEIGATEKEINALKEKRVGYEQKISDILEEQAKRQLKAYQDAVSFQQKQLSLIKALGGSSAEILRETQGVSEAYLQLLEYQRAQGAADEELMDTLLAYVNAKQAELDVQSQIADAQEREAKALAEAAEKQRELDSKYLSDTVALRKSEVDLAQKLGLSTEQQLALMRQYADAIVRQGKAMEANGESQVAINQLALTYLGVMEDIWNLENGKGTEQNSIQKDHLADLKSVVSLRESELKLMQAQNLGAEEQAAKYREILDATEDVGKYMAEIGESQAEINNTASDWYETLAKILSLQQKALDDLTDAAIEYLDTQEEAVVGPMQEQLALLKEQAAAEEDARKEEEKRLAVEKARIALQNALRQRNVRTYNASSGQWEWVANQKDVDAARKALVDAENDLAQYYAEEAHDSAVKVLEREIDYTKKSFSALRDAVKTASKAIADGKYTYEEAYDYIASQMHGIYDKYGIDLTNVMQTAVSGFEGVSRQIEETYNQIQTASLSFGSINSAISQLESDLPARTAELSLAFGGIGGALNAANYQYQAAAEAITETVSVLSQLPDWVRSLMDELMSKTPEVQTGGNDANTGGWRDTPSSGRDYQGHTLNGETNAGGETMYHIRSETGRRFIEYAAAGETMDGADNSYWVKNADGTVTISKNGVTYQVGGVSRAYVGRALNGAVRPDGGTTYNIASAAGKDFVDNAAAGATLNSADGAYWVKNADGTTDISKNGITYRVYDSGGVLGGLGGIKATNRDELVVPPDITEKMLKPQRTVESERALRELGIIYGARSAPLTTAGANNSIGTQNNGNTYNINVDGVDMRNVSEGMTLGEMCSAARTLALH